MDCQARRTRLLGPLLGLVLALLVISPSHAQYLYLDADGDSLNSGWEWPDPDTATVDLYLVTDATLSGEPPTCTSDYGIFELWKYSVAIVGWDAPAPGDSRDLLIELDFQFQY